MNYNGLFSILVYIIRTKGKMARLLAPEGYVPTGRSEEEIRERMNLIPMMLLLSANTSLESREAVRLAWWEEIVLRQRDVDEEEAYEENERKG